MATTLKFYSVITMVRSGERRDLVITFDLRVLLTKDQRV